MFSGEEEVGDDVEWGGTVAEDGELSMGVGDEAGGERTGFLDAEDGGIRGFPVLLVGVDALAHHFLATGGVEHIINNLECEADVLAVLGEAAELRRGCVARHGTETEGGSEQRGGLVHVCRADFIESGPSAFVFQILNLPGNEAEAAGGEGKFLNHGGDSVTARWLGERDKLESLREEGVAGKDGDAFAENFMIGWFTPSEIVVVHTWEVVVDEGVGVDTFDGAGQRHGVGGFAVDGVAGGKGEDGSDTFTAGKQGVAHRFVDGGWLNCVVGDEFIERDVDAGADTCEVLVEVEAGGLAHGGGC